MTKKNNLIIVIVIIIILAVVAIITLKNRGKLEINENQSVTQTEKDLNQAIASDTTTSINANLNNIDVNDTTGDSDLKSVDQELQKL